MSSVLLFHTRKVRDVLKAPTGIYADALVLLFLGGIAGTLVMMGREASAPMLAKTVISLSFWHLPAYTLMSLSRGFAAYFLSLVFTLVYATVAAHSRRAEKIMIPALDVLQSIPVLSFLPTVVLAMIALFPTREIGLEIACVVMIFTGQAWNMTFSMYGSIKSLPAPLREAAQVYRFSAWRTFRLLELPASMIGLVWNSMMSMAGGWFVLTLSEAFTLQSKDFRLPGIGSYMGEAIDQFNRNVPATYWPIAGAIVAMVAMIVAVDQLFWRPIVVWSERFKMEETAEADKPQSWMLDLLEHSRLYQLLRRRMAERRNARVSTPPATLVRPRVAAMELVSAGGNGKPHSDGTIHAPSDGQGSGNGEAAAQQPISAGNVQRQQAAPTRRRAAAAWELAKPLAIGGLLLALAAGSAFGLWSLFKLLSELPFRNPATAQDWVHVVGALGLSFVRTSASIIIGAAWTLPAGIIIGLSPKWSQRLQPVVQVVASFPANMLFPLITIFLAYLHFPFTSGCVALMLLGTQWYILFNVIAGAMAIPGDMKEVQTVFGTGALRRWTRLYIPCVFPFLVTGMVTAAGGAWNATIVSEYVKVGDKTWIAFGIGSIISEATDAGNFPLLAAATVSLAITVVLINRFFWKRLYRIAEDRFSLNV